MAVFKASIEFPWYEPKGKSTTTRARSTARITEDLSKRDDRLELVRGRLLKDPSGDPWVEPVKGRGSHMLGNLALAECLIYFPKESEKMERGTEVSVELLRWGNG